MKNNQKVNIYMSLTTSLIKFLGYGIPRNKANVFTEKITVHNNIYKL